MKEKDGKLNNKKQKDLLKSNDKLLTLKRFEEKFHWSANKEDLVEYFSEEKEEAVDIKDYNPRTGEVTFLVIPDFKKRQDDDGINNFDINSLDYRNKIKVQVLVVEKFEKLISDYNFQYIDNWKKDNPKNKSLNKKTMEEMNSSPELEEESLESGNNSEANASEFKQAEFDSRAEIKKAREREKIEAEKREREEKAKAKSQRGKNPDDLGNVGLNVDKGAYDAWNDLNEEEKSQKEIGGVEVGSLDSAEEDADRILNKDKKGVDNIHDILNKQKNEKKDGKIEKQATSKKEDGDNLVDQAEKNAKIHEDEIGSKEETTTEDLQNPQPVFDEREEIKKAKEREELEDESLIEEEDIALKNREDIKQSRNGKNIEVKNDDEDLINEEDIALKNRDDIKKARAEKNEDEIVELTDLEKTEGDIDRLDELKFKMEKAYAQLVKEQEHEATEWSKLSMFEKLKNKIGFGKKEGSEDKSNPEQIQWEYSTVKDRVQRFKEEFSKSYEDYVQELIKKEKGEKGVIKEFIFSRPVIKDKTEDGKEFSKTVFEDFNGKLKDLDRVRIESMDKYEKVREGEEGVEKHFSKFCLGALKAYNKIPRSVRIAAMATTFGVVAGISGGTAAAGIAVAGKVSAVSLFSALVATPVIGKFFKGRTDKDFDKTSINISKAFSDMGDKMEKGDGQFLKQIEEFNKREKKRGVSRIATTGIVVGGISFATAGLFDGGATPESLSDNEVPLSSVPNSESIPESTPGPEAIPDPEVTPDSVEEISPVVAEKISDLYTAELAKGDTVWGKLVDYFDGSEGKTAETINEFRKETAKDLMKNYGMSTEQADNFTKWRFRHMNVGEGLQVDVKGDLQIDKFITKDQINKFNRFNKAK